MKKYILFIFCIGYYSLVLGQVYEVGVSVGGTNYVGDIGRTNYIYPNKPAAALLIKYNWNPRIALTATYSYLPIKADNKNADRVLPLSNGIDISNYRFSNTINELAFGLEYNFYEYDLSSEDKNWTPYILLELAAFNYSSVKEQTPVGDYVFHKKTSFTLPFGVGIKSKLFGDFAIALETKFRYTFEDDLDYSTARIPALNFGSPGKDWYMFTGVSFIYTFGRPACYTNGM